MPTSGSTVHNTADQTPNTFPAIRSPTRYMPTIAAGASTTRFRMTTAGSALAMFAPKIAANGAMRYGHPRPTAVYGRWSDDNAHALVQYQPASSPFW
jgi:hypothetical protein